MNPKKFPFNFQVKQESLRFISSISISEIDTLSIRLLVTYINASWALLFSRLSRFCLLSSLLYVSRYKTIFISLFIAQHSVTIWETLISSAYYKGTPYVEKKLCRWSRKALMHWKIQISLPTAAGLVRDMKIPLHAANVTL